MIWWTYCRFKVCTSRWKILPGNLSAESLFSFFFRFLLQICYVWIPSLFVNTLYRSLCVPFVEKSREFGGTECCFNSNDSTSWDTVFTYALDFVRSILICMRLLEGCVIPLWHTSAAPQWQPRLRLRLTDSHVVSQKSNFPEQRLRWGKRRKERTGQASPRETRVSIGIMYRIMEDRRRSTPVAPFLRWQPHDRCHFLVEKEVRFTYPSLLVPSGKRCGDVGSGAPGTAQPMHNARGVACGFFASLACNNKISIITST